jgi:hypothetical protein
VFLYVCDQDTPKSEAKGPSWTISACELMNINYYKDCKGLTLTALLRAVWFTYPEVVAHETVDKWVDHAVSIGKPMACKVRERVHFAFIVCLEGVEPRNKVVKQ